MEKTNRSFFYKQKCSTASKPDGIILNQFLIENSESNADDAQPAAEDEAKVYKFNFFFL